MEILKPLILILDNDLEKYSDLVQKLKKQYTFKLFNNSKDALKMLQISNVHFFVCAEKVENKTGINILANAIITKASALRILISENPKAKSLDQINKMHVFSILKEDFSINEFDNLIDKGFKLYFEGDAVQNKMFRLQKTNEQLEFILTQKIAS